MRHPSQVEVCGTLLFAPRHVNLHRGPAEAVSGAHETVAYGVSDCPTRDQLMCPC
jgi:hypothetical protein